MQISPSALQELSPYVIAVLSGVSGYFLKKYMSRADDELAALKKELTELAVRTARMEERMMRLSNIEDKLDAVLKAGFIHRDSHNRDSHNRDSHSG